MLHDTNLSDNTPPREGVNQEGLNNHHVVEPVSSTSYQVVPVTLINNDKSVATHAFLDTGSSLTLLDSDVADSLSLQGEKRPLQLIWTQEQQSNHEDSQSVQVRFKGVTKKGYTLKGIRTVKNMMLPKQTFNYSELSKQYSNT